MITSGAVKANSDIVQYAYIINAYLILTACVYLNMYNY